MWPPPPIIIRCVVLVRISRKSERATEEQIQIKVHEQWTGWDGKYEIRWFWERKCSHNIFCSLPWTRSWTWTPAADLSSLSCKYNVIAPSFLLLLLILFLLLRDVVIVVAARKGSVPLTLGKELANKYRTHFDCISWPRDSLRYRLDEIVAKQKIRACVQNNEIVVTWRTDVLAYYEFTITCAVLWVRC